VWFKLSVQDLDRASLKEGATRQALWNWLTGCVPEEGDLFGALVIIGDDSKHVYVILTNVTLRGT
jgi:hypothetical protein